MCGIGQNDSLVQWLDRSEIMRQFITVLVFQAAEFGDLSNGREKKDSS